MIAATLSLAALVTLASAKSIDNSVVAAAVLDSAQTFDGMYTLTNVGTGKVLSFDGTDFTTQGSGQVQLEPVSTSGMDGVAISDGTSRCASAQWGFQNGDAWDHAAVAYSCAIGSHSEYGTKTLELTKQVWTFVPCGDSSADDATFTKGTNLAVENTSSTKATQSDNDATQTDDSATKSSNGKYPSGVNPYDRTTWVCKHPGDWLAAHQGYVTKAGHVECKDELAAYLAKNSRKSKRFHHAELAHALAKRSSKTYCIVTTDHLKDMEARAISSTYKDTYGGWVSQVLAVLDKSDETQQWIVQSA